MICVSRISSIRLLVGAVAACATLTGWTSDDNRNEQPAIILDGSDVRRELRAREEKVEKLSAAERAKLKEARERAAADPEVQAALAKRDAAIREFRATVRRSMIASDPEIERILHKAGNRSGQ